LDNVELEPYSGVQVPVILAKTCSQTFLEGKSLQYIPAYSRVRKLLSVLGYSLFKKVIFQSSDTWRVVKKLFSGLRTVGRRSKNYFPVFGQSAGGQKIIFRSPDSRRVVKKLFFGLRTVGGRSKNYFPVSGQSAGGQKNYFPVSGRSVIAYLTIVLYRKS
jgi:hypothetical protein